MSRRRRYEDFPPEDEDALSGGEDADEGQIRVYHRCGGCGKKQEFVNSGKFRVNANGKNVDVWLIYRCKKCKHSWNLTVYERTRPGRIPPELFEAFQDNDWDTAMEYGRDLDFLKRNRADFTAPRTLPTEYAE